MAWGPTPDSRAGEKATAWYRFKWKTDWLWWVAGGYCASALIFNVADGLNHFLVPPTLFDDDTLVTKMVNPEEGRGVASILVGGVAPCVTAPWWEEVLYRGFLLRALERLCGRADVATVVSSRVESTSEFCRVDGVGRPEFDFHPRYRRCFLPRTTCR